MVRRLTRRHFLRTAAAGAAVHPLCPATAAETVATPDIVRYGPDIEPIVRLIEQTPIDRCPAMLAEQLRKGLPYRRFLAALFLAALRGPSTIAHSVFVIHSAHQLGLDVPAGDRLLPLFWSLNNYKYWANWHAKNPDRLRPPAGDRRKVKNAEAEFHAAMDGVDPEKAEAALLTLARGEGMSRVARLACPYVPV